MRALLCKRHGEPKDLVVEDIPSPRAGPGEIVVSVKAAGVNFPDLLMIQNKYQHKPPLPFSPGYEFAGVIKELGDGVQGLQVGDAGIALNRWGGFAEEVSLPAERFWRIPASLDFRTAAAFPVAYGTSYHALKDRAHLQPGETLLVLGAAGGVGLAAVQVGKLMGARVIACASSEEKLATCRRYGADILINYRERKLRDAIKELGPERGIDVVLDPIGGEYAEPAVRSMAWDGRYLVVGFAAGEIPRIALNLPLLKGCSIVGVAWDAFARRFPSHAQANIRELVGWIESGKLEPVITKEYRLAEASVALQKVLDRTIQGKVVIIP